MAQRTVTVSFHGCTRAVGAFLFSCGLLLLCDANAALTGRILIAGYGPELPVVQDLAKAYERLHPGTAIDLEWDSTVRAVHLVKTGEAQIAVTDQPDPALRATQIAWDGIAVIVNFANPVRAVSSTQVRGLFSTQLTSSCSVPCSSPSSNRPLQPSLQTCSSLTIPFRHPDTIASYQLRPRQENPT